jgi:hypothetical protein
MNHLGATNRRKRGENAVRDSVVLAANKKRHLSTILKRLRSARKVPKGVQEAPAHMAHRELTLSGIRVTAL